MDNKRAIGKFYTRGNPFKLHPFKNWVYKANIHEKTILEPFAGAKNIPDLIDSAELKYYDWELYDLQPGANGIQKRNTLTDFPKGYKVCITNPPWLARNSATRRGLPYPIATSHDDIYKYALELCLNNCDWIAAIIPEAFIRSNLFLERLSDFISLVPEKQHTTSMNRNTNNVNSMFEDTEHPVGLALFSPNETPNIIVWRNNQKLGRLKDLEGYLPEPSRNRNIRFNEPNGNLGLVAIDNTVSPSIRFCPPKELGNYVIRYHGRSITKISVPWKVDAGELNTRLNYIRQKTHDVFLTAFKGLRRDGFYRRRLDWALARSIIDEHLD